jgi:hypothetical protein
MNTEALLRDTVKRRNSGLWSFVVQQAISTVGAGLLGSAIIVLLAFLLAALQSGGHLVDRMVDGQLFRLGTESPYFAAPVLTAFILGALSHRLFGSRAALWVWALPTLILVLNVLMWKSSTPRSNLEDALANLFSGDCGDSECLYELFVTAPFYTSVAYTMGWIIRSMMKPKH